LEDRIVKRVFADMFRDCVCPPDFPVCVCGHRATMKPITKKPVTAGEDEILNNSRSKSAKLRIAEKI
ncbi:MAG: 16S rRNA (cytosine(1402)-N(4))-methyltransferase, partial [Firmicutes bacterium]|nr:16S rRNA (cytosine(1402)-N(4))-methyltransferase [Bacillota bacterium]